MANKNGATSAGPPGDATRHGGSVDESLGGAGSNSREPHAPVGNPIDTQVVADPGGTRFLSDGHPAYPDPDQTRGRRRWRIAGLLIGVAMLGVAAYYLTPILIEALSTISTDDAFVAGHVTNVSPRIEDVVTEVRVDQHDHVEPGTLLVRLDRQPFEVAAARARATVEEAGANLVQARAQVKAQIATARSNWYRRQNSQERLREQVAALRARVATLRAREASQWLAEVDQRRIENLVKRGSATQAELDQRNETLRTAREQVKGAWAEVQETRAILGLGPDYVNPLAIPRDLEEKQSTVQTAVSEIASSLAQIGIPFDPKDGGQVRAFEQFLRPEGGKSAGQGLEAVIEHAPAVRVARAALAVAARDLDNAELRLSYTEIRSEIAGYIQDRSVNPGNHVEPGQTLLSIRPLHVWIEANYKETQIRDIRIGMPVDLHVDAYPKRVFKGRVAGLSPATGLAGALLPPENATGNYVKVTQRLPIRIDLVEPNPPDTPLFVGLSVVPRVRYQSKPTGPGAGQRLHSPSYPLRPDVGGGPAGILPQNRDPEPGVAPSRSRPPS